MKYSFVFYSVFSNESYLSIPLISMSKQNMKILEY